MNEIIQAIRDLIDQAINFVRPPRAFAWQSSLWLSVFSSVMASLSQADWLSNLLMDFAWLFLIVGVNWALLVHPIRIFGVHLGPWITGALVCLYVFDRPDGFRVQAALISWPLFAAAIAAVPVFLSKELRLQTPSPAGWQSLVLLILVNLLLSCWIQFAFRIQTWFDLYPTLSVADFSQSAFVIPVGTELSEDLSQGEPLLTEFSTVVAADLSDQPWSATERWLFSVRNEDTKAKLAERTKANIDLAAEAHFWQLDIQPQSSEAQSTIYQVVLAATWVGPHAGQERPVYARSCRVVQTTSSAGVNFSTATSVTPQDLSATPLTTVDCGRIEKTMVTIPSTSAESATTDPGA